MLATMTMQLINKQSIERTHHSWKNWFWELDFPENFSKQFGSGFPNVPKYASEFCWSFFLPNFASHLYFLNFAEDFFWILSICCPKKEGDRVSWFPFFVQLWHTQGVITAARAGYDNRDDNYDDDEAVGYSGGPGACSIVKCQVQRRSFQRSAVEHFCEVEFKFKVLAEQLSTELSIWALLGSLCSAV